MKIHRFITAYEIRDGSVTIQDPELVHQFRNVLKFKTGEVVMLTNDSMLEATVRISHMSKDTIDFEVIDEGVNNNEPKNKVTLYLAILKRENFELVVQKATEIGIDKIVPIITKNTVKTGLRYDRLEKIAKEASELSGRSTVPTITEAIEYTDAIAQVKDTKNKIIFDISGSHRSDLWETQKDSMSRLIFVGPEGGFTQDEINQAKDASFTVASLGTLTLRGETAAIVASYISISS